MPDAALREAVARRLHDEADETTAWYPLVLAALDGADGLAKHLARREPPLSAGLPHPPPPTPPQQQPAAPLPQAPLPQAPLPQAPLPQAPLPQAPTPQAPTPQAPAEPRPAAAFLRRIAVEGFRGIGPPATLELLPGPGLTLVVGRNGCGKSSFAEALELLVTAETYRWKERSKVWREGFRNLHHRPTAIRADFAIEGEPTPCTVVREWREDAAIDEAAAFVQCDGRPRAPLTVLGWTGALEIYRPFLSYSELGSMLEAGPSELFDALARILGLDDLVQAQNALQKERTTRSRALDAADAARTAILGELRKLESDGRAGKARAALERDDWDLDEIERLVAGRRDDEVDALLDLLRRLALFPVPEPEVFTAAAAGLREAAAREARAAAGLAGRARDLTALLEKALDFHQKHGDGDCPVCGRAGALDHAWRLQKTREAAALKHASHEAQAAREALARAESAARGLVAIDTALLARARSIRELEGAAVAVLEAMALLPTAGHLADTLDLAARHVAPAVAALRHAASVALARREDAWRPLALRLAAWLEPAREARAAAAPVPLLKRAEDWLKDAGEDIRNDRFAPIAAQATAIWNQLKLQSNVSLTSIRLKGDHRSTRRSVELDVTVDGQEGAALGVMSQGELHSLALSLFIPRATLAESPFRFVVIDDPVQSMDPARVDGLARVLDAAGKERQVVVFTHDDRLPEAVRRLGIAATVVEVARREGSIVETRAALDPVSRYLEDARAVVKDRLPSDVARRVVPGLCRSALEAACMEAVRRRRIGRGEPHAAVEKTLLDAQTLSPLAALAVFDDAGQTGQVTATVKEATDETGAKAFQACKSGAHGDFGGDLSLLVQQAERVARWLEARA